jgi:hypothetical protein
MFRFQQLLWDIIVVLSCVRQILVFSVAPDLVGGTIATLGAYFPGETEGLVVAIFAATEDDEER